MNHAKRIKLGLIVGSILVASTLTVPSYADERSHPHQWNTEERTEHFQKHLDDLHSKLNLNSAQEAAWQTYAHKITPLTHPEHQNWEELSKLPAPERLDKMIELKSARLEKLKEHSVALKEFYATLSTEQKTIFDLATQHPKKDELGEKEHHREHNAINS